MWNTWTIISFVSFVIGIILNFFVLLSLPYFPSQDICVSQIDYESPINGTLGGFELYNLTRIRVGNWATCYWDLRSGIDGPDNVQCTPSSVFGYRVILGSDSGLNTTLVDSWSTFPLVLHIAGTVSALVAVLPSETHTRIAIAAGVNFLAAVWDFILCGIIKSKLRGTDSTVFVGSEPTTDLVSIVFLVVGHFARIKGE